MNAFFLSRGWRFFLFALLAGGAIASAAEPARRPNVLLIISDDLRPELGCYGVAGIRTPHLDALAARSVRFERAICQYPLCNPQRTSMLTGRYPTQTGVMDNRQWWGAKNRTWKTLPRWFREHGYATLRSGKIFHEGIDDAEAWQEGGEPRRYADDASEKIDGRDRNAKTPPPGETGNRVNASDRFEVYPGHGETNGDYRNATRAIGLLHKYGAAPAQPFFLACGFSKPHSPPGAPQKFYDLYDVARTPLPRDFAPRPTVPPGFPELSVVPRNTDLFIGRDASEDQAREMKRAYWASVSYMDDNVGRVLAALDELGLRQNTIVVFVGDHGYHLGEKGRWSKAYSLFDVATRVPLLIAAPGVTPAAGGVSARTVEVINLYRTLADLCGLPPPQGVEGASLKPLLLDPAAAWDRPAYSVVQYRGHLGRAVTTSRWHFAEWDGGSGGAMLLDLAGDPAETTNLAAAPAHARTVADLKALLGKLPE